MTNRLLCVGALMTAAGSAQANTLLWDYGPSQGSPSFCWSNTNGGQEFHEDTVFGSTVQINEYHYFSCFSGLKNNTFQIEAKIDNAGTPSNTPKFAFQDVPDSETDLGNGIYEYVFTFPNQQQNANEVLYWGCSGIGFEAALMGVYSPGNGMTWQFNNEQVGFQTSIGDTMFQLYGAVPAPGSAAVLGLGGLVASRRRRA